jgi:hypothetical protein
MTIFVAPEMSADGLRQTLYDGNLVILKRLRVGDFVEYTREQLTELFRPYDPEHSQAINLEVIYFTGKRRGRGAVMFGDPDNAAQAPHVTEPFDAQLRRAFRADHPAPPPANDRSER